MSSVEIELVEISSRESSSTKVTLIEAAADAVRFQQLLDETQTDQITKTLFTNIVRKLNHHQHAREYEKSYYILLRTIPPEVLVEYVNARDEDGKIPLEYVAELQKSFKPVDFDVDGVMKTLLDNGASLSEMDSRGRLIIQRLLYEKVRGYLDGCVTEMYDHVSYDMKNFLPYSLAEYVNVLEVLIHINKSLKAYLTHPLIAMLVIYVSKSKWKSYQIIFNANFYFFVLFYLSICLQVANCYYPMDNTWTFLLITTCLVAIREIFQFAIAPKLYICTIENWLEMGIIALTITASCLEDKLIIDQLVVFAFLFSTFDLLLQAGRHIRFIRYIQLLKAVLKNFAHLSILMMIIIIAFAICFNVLFNLQPLTEPPFETLENSIFKAMIMVNHEYDASSLKYSHHPIGSHLMLILFVITVSIVLMNVILGLAVSDIQNLERNSRLHGYMATIEFLYQVESLLLKPKAKMVFGYLGRIHKSLDLSEKCMESLPDPCQWQINNPHLPDFGFTTEIADEVNQREIRTAVNKLTHMVEKLDVKLTSLENRVNCNCHSE